MPGCATGGAIGRLGGPVTDVNLGADDAVEADVNAVWPLAVRSKLNRGRSDATVVLVVRVTAPRHLGVIRGGQTRQKIGLGNVPRGGAGRCCPALGL